MQYLGIQQQITRNNTKSILFLLAFPLLILAGVYVVLYVFSDQDIEQANSQFVSVIPPVLIGVTVWFFISYFFHTQMIQMATQSEPLERRENMRVYNLTENLCMSVGMTMPKLYIIESDALNAFASGINEKTFSVTLTRGIINTLNDEELEGVIAHELTHIRNRDVRLLIVTIVFVGIFATIADLAFRMLLNGQYSSRNRKNTKGGGGILLILLVAGAVYFLSILFKLALSRSREYMADAGAVEITHNSLALANALRKISGHSTIKGIKNDEVKELFIDYKAQGFFSLFATHPPIEKRIKILEQY
ncbi:M48 family metallopeptidase [Capnocytophaga sp. oral taxon 338]|uniref:M48 family metallopeptidase n=1 Tax=Capnocytophaga sp. oral taxon 338 TaxID=710239 RepID=UPI000202E092|nr:M48 family metallopeptidase [Capnocytophaga sp. oral taxon 338]EGD33211.1 heat shock protein HtpX [Capnocytophaga sp. oral taxon 338 str. F0234]